MADAPLQVRRTDERRSKMALIAVYLRSVGVNNADTDVVDWALNIASAEATRRIEAAEEHKSLRYLLISKAIGYRPNWAIYAEKLDGEFQAQSRARIGESSFEGGGILDGFEYFCACDYALDMLEEIDWEDLISQINQRDEANHE